MTPLQLGRLQLTHCLIQGPLAGISAAPFRRLFYQYTPPAYAVTEMISAHDVLTKHALNSRYLYRAAEETRLCYQLSGTDPKTMADAAKHLQQMGADLIDINCGCPKAKIRKKGAGSALMDNAAQLQAIVHQVKVAIDIPLTVKLRIYGHDNDFLLAKMLANAGVDALIIHGRKWTDDYHVPCDFQQIGFIKKAVNIPVIANGDIHDAASLAHAVKTAAADAYMISRAGCGRPWLFQQLLNQSITQPSSTVRLAHFMQHIRDLSVLETPFQAVMQSKTLVRYYFRELRGSRQLQDFYALTDIDAMAVYLGTMLSYCTPSVT